MQGRSRSFDCSGGLKVAKRVFARVGDVKKPVRKLSDKCHVRQPAGRRVDRVTGCFGGDLPVLILVLLVDAAHQRGCRRKDLVDEDEDGLLRRQLDPLANDVDELADGKICWYQVLLLVDGGDVALLDLFADDLKRRMSANDLDAACAAEGAESNAVQRRLTKAFPRLGRCFTACEL